MKISIITVCYNAQEFIERTIWSVINQTYSDIEYIIVDGNSIDDTKDIVKKYTDHISVYISEKDSGIYDAMNKGINLSSGDYIVFLNAGDVFHNCNVINDMVKTDMDADIVCGSVNVKYKGEVHVYKPGNLKDTHKYMPIPHPGMFIKGNYHKNHLYDISFKSSGDYDFVYKAVYMYQASFQFVDVIVTDYDNEGGMSKNNHKKARIEDLRVKGIQLTAYRKFMINCNAAIYSVFFKVKEHTPSCVLKLLHKLR